jgi:hypothetical protein
MEEPFVEEESESAPQNRAGLDAECPDAPLPVPARGEENTIHQGVDSAVIVYSLSPPRAILRARTAAGEFSPDDKLCGHP